MRIAEVAQRSGFTPATLRYYETIGLLDPARTAGGYRAYDERSVDRLAFIARAKQLGCTLDEIVDLVVAWDGGRCGPLQERLGVLVTAKLAGTRARVAELVTFAAELERAGADLARHRPEGPCDERCGCVAAAPGTVEIACSLDADAMPDRLQDWHRLLSFARRRSQLVDGVRVELDRSVPLTELAELVAAEHACCRFFAFAVTVDDRGVGLEIRAPADALPIVHALVGRP
jgi:DNA-binding transcriptional MerR regulator